MTAGRKRAARTRLTLTVAAIGAAALLAAGCGEDSSGSGSAAAAPPVVTTADGRAPTVEQLRSRLEGRSITIGSAAFPNPSLVGLYKVAEILRADFGLDVELRLLDSAPLTAALLSGDVQLGHVSLAGLASAVEAGGKLRAIAGDDQKNIFLVTARAPIRSIEELKGKKFAISQSLTSIVGQTAAKCFRDAGLDVQKDTQLLQLDNVGSIVEGLESGTFDGGVSATFRQIELDERSPGEWNVLCNGWEADPQLNDVVAANEQWLADNGDVAQAVAIAELQAARWTKQDPAGWQALAIEQLDGLTPAQARANYGVLVEQLDDWPVNGSLDRELCDYTLRTSKEVGALRDELACDDLVTFQYQDAAVALLGKR
ncbi:ABC transporter substrate-binding protein [Conexibacter woesei]|nr:PhnD/SsuA/transferrin family substrate-binding protein [Conexibacter woesei]